MRRQRPRCRGPSSSPRRRSATPRAAISIRLYGKNPDYLARQDASSRRSRSSRGSASRTSCCTHAKMSAGRAAVLPRARAAATTSASTRRRRSRRRDAGRSASTASGSRSKKASGRAVLHVPFPRRQRVDRAAAGQPPGSRRAFRAATTWSRSCRRRRSPTIGSTTPARRCGSGLNSTVVRAVRPSTARRRIRPARTVRVAYLRGGKMHAGARPRASCSPATTR